MSDRSADGHRSVKEDSSDEDPPRATSATSSARSGKSSKVVHRPDYVSKGDMKRERSRAQAAEADLQRQLEESSTESAEARQMVTQLKAENEQMKLQYVSTRTHMQEQEEKNEAEGQRRKRGSHREVRRPELQYSQVCQINRQEEGPLRTESHCSKQSFW